MNGWLPFAKRRSFATFRSRRPDQEIEEAIELRRSLLRRADSKSHGRANHHPVQVSFEHRRVPLK